MNSQPVFHIESLTKLYGNLKKGEQEIRAVDNLNFSLSPGKIFGIIGKSGSGKTTLMRLLLRLIPPTTGIIKYKGRDITQLENRQLKRFFRPHVRAVFQHPEASMNPAFKVKKILEQPLRMYAQMGEKQIDEKVNTTVEQAGLSTEYLERYPDELSGGEKKRVSFCRAIIGNPGFIIADEPFSGLDASLQWLIRDMILRINHTYGTTFVIISHDLHIIKPITDTIFFMENGCITDCQKPSSNGEWNFKHESAQKLNHALLNSEHL